MVSHIKSLPDKFYKFWLRLANLENKTSIFKINFHKHWMYIIWEHKKYLFIALLFEIFTKTFYTLIPIFIGWIVEQQKFIYFYILIIVWFFAIIGEYISVYFATILECQCIASIKYNASEFFLTVDPIYHTIRPTGKLFAKIERGARSYEDFLDIILWDLSPVIISILTVIVSFLLVDIKLGLLALVLLFLTAIVNILSNVFTSISFEKNLIKADDKFKIISRESLTQIQLIRSCFASNEIDQAIKQRNKELMVAEGTAWLSFGGINFITRFIYLISVLFLGSYLLNSVQLNYFSALTGITLLLTYIRGTADIILIGRRLRKLLRAAARIKDLFLYIKDFGKQTFPVFIANHEIQNEILKKRETIFINLDIKDLYFDYTPKARIFENHSLHLNVPRAQQNKLYGIIGPSGMGKTTLLSILGGQLKPTQGEIKINDISVYDIDDSARRRIIAIQGQIASSLSGTLRRNLLIGVPSEAIFSDDELIMSLKNVGLWQIFEEQKGLDTQIGEGGITMSGGQRQRLNFASLYLRANYYRPLLILIDEPTSSLDEISEKAITNMIDQLAQHALTLVIAHRLKTLENAIGILDFSLIDQEKEIKFYSKYDLEKKSSYYNRLLQGQININL